MSESDYLEEEETEGVDVVEWKNEGRDGREQET